MKILIINGPNLNLIGRREPEIYGTQSLDEYLDGVKKRFPEHQIDTFQSNHEGCLIDKLHEAMSKYDGVVMNPGGYAHTSLALADAVRAIAIPVVEVHISNIFEREAFRHHSYTAEAAVHTIVGHGLEGYAEAIIFLTSFRL